MTPEAAKKAVGGANETSTTRIGKDYLMTQTYGKDDFLSVDYRSNDCGKTYKISNFMVDYDFAKQSLTDIEKVVGKPDRSEKGSYVEEENGVKGKRIPTVMNEYGNVVKKAKDGIQIGKLASYTINLQDIQKKVLENLQKTAGLVRIMRM
ncbi:hypothetical protein BFS35_012755 [Macrococcoides goetzii]|uniref:Uncharacterized protein n=1 Tax=Macrococcoides goetzii TaxID=1891097 RepID=A0A2G5NWL0_9STAP|nr:hypothetical protein [Macrococcus goetzii]RAI79081.1 hypothetical protein BFS35_012755 [Macrococcus goetzii]